MPLYFITSNAGKFREIKAIIPDIEQLRLDLDEIQSLDPQAVIEHKLNQASTHLDGEFLVEDTSLIFNCIKPLPGTMVKWFEESLGASGMSDLVLRYADHTAIAKITIGYRDIHGQTHFFVAQYSGEVVNPRGDNGFGWDPMFIAVGQTKTNAELSTDEKNVFSARGKAARQLAEYLSSAKPA